MRAEGDVSQLVPLLSRIRKLRLVDTAMARADYTARIFPPVSPLLLSSSPPFFPLRALGSVMRSVGKRTKRENLQEAGTFLLDFIKF